MLLRRLLGTIMFLVALAGLALCSLSAYYGPAFLDGVTDLLADNLGLASQSLGAVEETLQLARSTMEDVQGGLRTLDTAILDLSRVMTQTEPLLTAVGRLTSQEVPDSLEAVQAAVPRMAQAAGVVEAALTTLSNLRLEQRILGIPLRFDLGFEYAPESTMAESISDLGSSLEGVIPRLRGLESHLETATGSLDVMAENLSAASADVRAINDHLSGFGPLLDSHVATARQVQARIDIATTTLTGQLDRIRGVLWVALGWLALLQLIPLYLAWELFTQRPVRSD